MKTRDEIIKRMANALYEYSNLNGSGPVGNNIVWKASSGFRQWRINCYDGRICFSMDGFKHRAGEKTGAVLSLIGDGKFILPYDDSCGNHCMEVKCTEGSTLLNITFIEQVNWEPRIEKMADIFEEASKNLKIEIEQRVRKQKESYAEERNRLIEQARQICSQG